LHFRQPLPAAGLELRLLQLRRRPVPLRYGTQKKKTVQIRSARGGIQSNRRKKKTQPRVESRITPPQRASTHPYPLLLRVARGGRRCGRCGITVSHLAGEWVDCRRLGRRDSSTCGAGGGGDGETLKSDAASGEGREEAGG
jgi:hypothetical protein